jgi:dual specificity tyrosine-phosphorylation-regulated kinase 2/3/4
MKPENIIFTDDSYSSIKIIDFGSSCTDSMLGFSYVQSRYYRAPEVVLGIHYGHPVDMWSLGCIVYELITGRPIFPGRDENELLEYIIVTVGKVPQEMLESAKKYKTFYKKTNNYLSFYNHELIRSKESRLPQKLEEGS